MVMIIRMMKMTHKGHDRRAESTRGGKVGGREGEAGNTRRKDDEDGYDN